MTAIQRGSSGPELDLSLAGAFPAFKTFQQASAQADRLGCMGRAFWVYAVELEGHINLDRPDATTLFIGQTHNLTPEERMVQHRSDHHRADQRVRDHGTQLRHDLYEAQPELRTRQEADAYQALLVQKLEGDGFSLYTET